MLLCSAVRGLFCGRLRSSFTHPSHRIVLSATCTHLATGYSCSYLPISLSCCPPLLPHTHTQAHIPGPPSPLQSLEETRAALEAEQGKSMRLEVELAEAAQKLGRMEELERELQKYRCAPQAGLGPQARGVGCGALRKRARVALGAVSGVLSTRSFCQLLHLGDE